MSRHLCCATAAVVLALFATAPRAHAQSADSVRDLPLISMAPKGTATDQLAVLATGDGGWASIDKELTESLASRGIAVIGFDSPQYLSRERTPELAAHDLERVLRYYLSALGKRRVLLVGYSRGADILPFMASRLPRDLLGRVQTIALLGPAHTVNFKFHLIDLISNKSRQGDLPTVPEIEKLRGKRILCFYGEDEKDTACTSLEPTLATSYRMPGGHHFGGKYGEIAAAILNAAN